MVYYLTYFVFLFRNYFILNYIDYNTKNKKNIKENVYVKLFENTQQNFNDIHVNIFKITCIETFSFYLLHSNLDLINNYYSDLIIFIPVSFIYEIIFDFFHYCIHRSFHMNHFLYTNIHKKHHKNYNLTSIVTFDQTLSDFIFTVCFPEIISLFIFQSVFFKISTFQFLLILNYKIFSEIAGHSGKHTKSCGFVQFIWLPKFFNIELVTEDHDLHHNLLLCNYSKRFKLWDKVFNSYKSSNV